MFGEYALEYAINSFTHTLNGFVHTHQLSVHHIPGIAITLGGEKNTLCLPLGA